MGYRAPQGQEHIMENIPLPQTFNEESLGSHESTFTIEPFFPGFGRTVGNALRRVLLSSMSGSAITSVKIEGVQHEFSDIAHVKEDVVDIVLNLKKVHVKAAPELFADDQEVTLTLKVDGAKKVTAGDIEAPAGVEIMNPKQHIATLTDDASGVDMTLKVGYGRGYDPVEARKEDTEKTIGQIDIDALYTPVLAVGYDIESTRVGKMTNWDRVKLTVETNGVISPKDALLTSAQMLVEQFTSVAAFESAAPEVVEEEPAVAPEDEASDEAPAEAEEENKEESDESKED